MFLLKRRYIVGSKKSLSGTIYAMNFDLSAFSQEGVETVCDFWVYFKSTLRKNKRKFTRRKENL